MNRDLSNSKKWLVYVESPLQLENAIAFSTLEDAPAFYYIRLNGVSKNDSQLRSLAESSDLKCRFFKVSGSGSWKWLQSIKLIFMMVLSVTSSQFVVFGDDRSFVFRSIHRFISPNRIKFVDDGAYSFISIKKYENSFWSGVEWFTRFSSLSSDFVNVKYLPSEKVKIKEDDWVLVIGAPLSEEGVITKKDHVELVERLFSFLKSELGASFKYFPHRKEAVVYSVSGVEFISSNVNVEEYLESVSDQFPNKIFSFYSTAIFNISEFFSDATILYIDVRRYAEVDKNFKLSLDAVYEVLPTLSGVSEFPFFNEKNF